MTEVRCPHCGAKLAEEVHGYLRVRCGRCRRTVTLFRAGTLVVRDREPAVRVTVGIEDVTPAGARRD